ncbi:MAG: MBL fold metallo-hydrolase [Magnetococcales bacterium]|nr:MBL fold metallo-hydrolase [Magnetococcales bacterium]
MRQIDHNKPVPITREIHWVGFYDQSANLHCNPYLLIEDEEAVLFDPGSIPHFPIVMRKVIDLISPSDISVIIAAHQDPDVCGNLPVVEDVIDRSDLLIAAHMNTIRLIRHYGVKSTFYPVDEKDYKLTLKSGRVLRFIPTPYLHSPGAVAVYDQKTRSLFSSDLFGAIYDNWALFAREGYPQAMDSWHQLYMPCNQILRHTMEQFEQLEIDRILPQHGSILEGERVKEAIDHLKNLACGFDLIDAPSHD